jgi:uncharacterized protein YggE
MLLRSFYPLFLLLPGKICAECGDMSSNTINIFGIGYVAVKPNAAYIPVTVKGTGVLIEDAYKDLDEHMQKIDKLIKENNIPVLGEIKDSPVLYIGDENNYRSSFSDQKKNVSPHISNIIYLKILPDQEVVRKLLNILIRNNIAIAEDREKYSGERYSSVIYTIEAPEKYEDEAIALAFEDSRKKAERFSKDAKLPIGEIQKVSEINFEKKRYERYVSSTEREKIPFDYISSYSDKVEIIVRVAIKYTLSK